MMSIAAVRPAGVPATYKQWHAQCKARSIRSNTLVEDGRYKVRLAENASEMVSALRLRHSVFELELRNGSQDRGNGIEFEPYDLECRHLIVISKDTGETVGTYRLNSIKSDDAVSASYSASEFTVEDLPIGILRNGIEIGRACIAREHRNTKVLFLLWKALLRHIEKEGKRYYFGCCSIFSQDEEMGRLAFQQLVREGVVHDQLTVRPRRNGIDPGCNVAENAKIELPPLFNMYLRIGARVCGPPMIDREFGTIDFFVLFDVRELNDKYRRMFGK